MNEALQAASYDLAQFLQSHLPSLSEMWWNVLVVGRLSFQQQRHVQERQIQRISQLDLAALLRVLDQNWYELAERAALPREARSWVRELQGIRNKWAHLPTESFPQEELYRDADTLAKLLQAINCNGAGLTAAHQARREALEVMSRTVGDSSPETIAGDEHASEPVAGCEPDPDPRQVSLLQPANAVSLFREGELAGLRSNPSIRVAVLGVAGANGGETRYRVFQDMAAVEYFESQLVKLEAQTKQLEEVDSGRLRALLTAMYMSSPSTSTLLSFHTGRIQYVPYQYRPVLKLIRSDRPRLLIADEVGVGKTIEAGLILKELQARMEVRTVLVICPKPLISERKWYLEMKRFDEDFVALDGALLKHCLKETELDGDWPDRYAKAMVPFSLFDNALLYGGKSPRSRRPRQGLLAMDPPPRFDLVIVDEAHHIRNSGTCAHEATRFFCQHAEAVLLISATPVQLGSRDLYTLLNLVRPDLVIDFATFQQMAEPNPHINEAVQHCRRAGAVWQDEAREALERAARTNWGGAFLAETQEFQSAHDRLTEEGLGEEERVRLTRAIEDLYTFSSIINRTRRRDIGNFTTRKPQTLEAPFTTAQRELHDNLIQVVARILSYSHGQDNVAFMMSMLRRQAASCIHGLVPLLQAMLSGKLDLLELAEAADAEEVSELGLNAQLRRDVESLRNRAKELDEEDPKVEAFLRVLWQKQESANNKALVFSTFRHTLAYLEGKLERKELRFGVIHGGVQDEDRADLRSRFRLPREDADALDVLLSSEVGCEGLDFEFCDLLINYDLPWNPMRIEQRIGRIDRFGQKSWTVAIVNLITPGTVDAEIYERCLWRIGVFHQAVGGSEEILGTITSEIHHIAENYQLSPEERAERMQQLADNGIRRIQEEQRLEANEAQLFGLTVPRDEWLKDVNAAHTVWLSPDAILHCVETYLAELLEERHAHFLGEGPVNTLRLNKEARERVLREYQELPRQRDRTTREWEKWLKGDEPTLSVCFDRQAASDDARVVHLSPLHPLVKLATRTITTEGAGMCHLWAKDDALPQGTYPFQLYRWNYEGVRRDQRVTAVAECSELEDRLLVILASAQDEAVPIVYEGNALQRLEARHHERWREARANHIESNRQIIEQRALSLAISHRARRQAISDQLARAENPRIDRMRESQLAAAEADYQRQSSKLQEAAGAADIHTGLIVSGMLTIVGVRG